MEFKIGIMMTCGCAAQGTVDGKIGCGVHLCTEIAPEAPYLTGRTAICVYGGNSAPSKETLPFFCYKAGELNDEYYCGCFGWD